MKTGTKKDEGKERFDLIPSEALFSLARILTFGAEKYEDRNWERGILYGRVFAALQRHLWRWFMQQDVDEETGESHMAHALCCIVFLVTYEARGGNRSDWDDRSQWIFDYALTLSTDKKDEDEDEGDEEVDVKVPFKLPPGFHMPPRIKVGARNNFYPEPDELPDQDGWPKAPSPPDEFPPDSMLHHNVEIGGGGKR